jgi:hypothetical protein
VLQALIDPHPIETVPTMTSRGPRRQPGRREPYAEAGIEPALEDLLSDPLTQVLMHRDGVNAQTLRTLLRVTSERLRARMAA